MKFIITKCADCRETKKIRKDSMDAKRFGNPTNCGMCGNTKMQKSEVIV